MVHNLKFENFKKINKGIRVKIFSKQEWSLMAKKDPAFYERVEKDKVKL